MTLIALARTVSPLELAWRPYTRLFLVGERKSWSVDHDMRNDLAQIDTKRCPVVMMTGTYDYLTPPEATENTARQIKNGVFVASTLNVGDAQRMRMMGPGMMGPGGPPPKP